MAKSAKQLITTIVLNGKANPSVKEAFQKTQNQAEETYAKLNKLGNAIKVSTAAVATATTAYMAKSVKSAIEFETTLAKVSTLADTSVKSMSELSAEILKVSDNTGVAATEVSDAVYDALSSGADTAHVAEFVETAMKTAKAGFTDASTAIDGLTTIINSYGLATTDAEKIANQLLITQDKGKVTVDELAGSIGKVSSIASTAGLGTDELLSSIAALTASGINGAESVTAMKAAISNIVKPTSQAQKMAEQLGLDFSVAALQTKGWSGFLKDLQKKTGGNLETMAQLFGSTEALNAVLALTSTDGMALLDETIVQMATDTTALADSFNTMAGTPAERIAKLQNRFENLSIKVGELLLPYVEKLMGKIETIDFDKIFSGIETGFAWFMQNKDIILAGVVAIAGGMVAWNVIKMVQGVTAGIKMWKTATEGMTIAQKLFNGALNMSPIGIIITLITAVVAAVIYLWNTSDSFRKAVLNIWDGIVNGIVTAVNTIIGAINSMIGFIVSGVNGAIDLLNKIPGVNIAHVTAPVIQKVTLAAKDANTTSADGTVSKYGYGGRITSPEYAIVGDRPETIVPDGDTPRNRALLKTAAQKVTGGKGLGGGNQYIFAPTINGGDKQTVKQMLDEEFEKFKAFIEKYEEEKERVEFA